MYDKIQPFLNPERQTHEKQPFRDITETEKSIRQRLLSPKTISVN